VAEAAGKNAFHPFIGLREAGARVADEDPHVGLAVTIDVGDKLDIHPPRKRPVGERLALQARKLVYGDHAVVADGPVAREFRREGPGFVVTFDGVGGGLVARGDLAGFEVSDAAGVWHEAEATIRGNTVELRAAKVPEPEGVRYAWAGYPEATLFNQAGLPARPFRHPTLDLKAIQQESERAK
jgi:sialate O-acetylesterase